MMKNKKLKTKIQEGITNLANLGQIPAGEVQLNLDVAYNSVLEDICSVVPVDSPRQIISYLKLCYGSDKKAAHNSEDVIDASFMENTGTMPLDENGYITDNVEFTVSDNSFMGSFGKIVPGTVSIGTMYVDNGEGSIINKTTKEAVGTVDYDTAVFELNFTPANETAVKYKYDIYNLPTFNNQTYFQKAFTEVFATMFKFDVDSAITLNDSKIINLQQNIDKLLPEVLSQQIDSNILAKYFELADSNIVSKKYWKLTESDQYTLTDACADFGTQVGFAMGEFTSKTGVVPNVLLCNSKGLALLRANRGFKPLDDIGSADYYIGAPRLVGYFGTAKVFVTNNKDEKGKVVITCKGTSEAQTAGVYCPFIPVSLRTVTGSEGGGMIVTNNAYSIGGFKFINKDLISCVVEE